ncbi:ribonuclease H2 subunit B [Lycorma delicatula]|uniref:ribonuclease H2 subunit B n=1 Tax=Lycorma delicatula TaxID=130591 RepID=UPI003F50F181
MPRIKASPKKCVKSINSSQQSNSWVFLVKGDSVDIGGDGSATPDVVQLRHPQSGAPAMFLFSPGDSLVQEVLTFSENKRSWLIEESTKTDGKMQLSTPIDPLFLILPYLKKASHAVPLDQLLKDDEFPETERLLSSAGLKHINQIADRKGDEDLMAYKYNEEKTLNWLQRKVERVAEVLKQKGINVTTGSAVSNMFVKSVKTQPDSTENRLRYAHGVISEYLSDDLSTKLCSHIGLSPLEEVTGQKRKQLLTPSNNATANENKRSKILTSHDIVDDSMMKSNNGAVGALDLSKPEKVSVKQTLSSKDKSRSKAASGSKSISMYFKRK